MQVIKKTIHPKTVLISEPQVTEVGMTFLPITWGLLKTHWEHAGEMEETGETGETEETGEQIRRELIEWPLPLFLPEQVLSFFDQEQEKPIDVLGLSCYSWNWKLQCFLAREMKARYPHCLIVAGGPEPDYKDPEFFQKHPYIDVIVLRDGEITFTEILKKVIEVGNTQELVENKSRLGKIPGLYLPHFKEKIPCSTGEPQIPTSFVHSPYLEQNEHYEKMIQSISGQITVLWETNRGCPYKCDYCDWGSNTRSKIRKFEMERLKLEMEWFGKMQIRMINFTDANFGIFPRDLDIVDFLIETNHKYGFPKYFYYSAAKNNSERNIAIAKKCFGSGLIADHSLSIQHTHPEVLAAANRKNISMKKQYQVAQQLMQTGIPITVQLILGIPGDQLPYWKDCFADLMEWGIHSYYCVYPYSLLPNAPAADLKYQETWEIKTVERFVSSTYGARLKRPLNTYTEVKNPMIVESKTFSKEDWLQMNLYKSFIQSFHCCSITQLISIYLRFTHKVSYGEFYESLFEEFFQKGFAKTWFDQIKHHYQNYLEQDEFLDYMDIPQLPGFEYQIEPGHWLFIQISLNLEEFFRELQRYLLLKYPEVSHLESVIKYQQNLIILPDSLSEETKVFQTNHDWISYFKKAYELYSFTPLEEPHLMENIMISATLPLTQQRKKALQDKKDNWKTEGNSWKAEGNSWKAEGNSWKAEGNRRKTEGNRRKTEGDSWKTEGDSWKIEGNRGNQEHRKIQNNKEKKEQWETWIHQKALGFNSRSRNTFQSLSYQA